MQQKQFDIFKMHYLKKNYYHDNKSNNSSYFEQIVSHLGLPHGMSILQYNNGWAFSFFFFSKKCRINFIT